MRKIGISMGVPPPQPHNALDGAFMAKEAERLGFDSIWAPEHTVAPVEVTQSTSPFFEKGQVPGFKDPLIALGRASAVTSTIKLGTSVLLICEHNPLLLAKEVATLDYFSGGRFILGVGTGWLREEAEIMGVDFDHRATQAREAILAMKELWTKEKAEYHGKYYDFPPVRCWPQPAQKPHPPIFLGGVAPNVLKRVVSYGDGWAPERITPEGLKERGAELKELARAADRDPASIAISIHGKPADPEVVGAYLGAGADRVVVGIPVSTEEREATEHMERVARTVLPVAEQF